MRKVTLNVSDFLYKVIGDEGSLHEYNEYRRPSPTTPVSDWSACYLQCSLSHALGTLPYRWDQGYETAQLLRLSLRPDVSVAVVDDSTMASGAASGVVKARRCKEWLGVDTATPLWQSLERERVLLCMLETDGEAEVVVPHSMVSEVVPGEEVVAHFRQRGGVTSARRLPGDSGWSAFEDADALALPDSLPRWFSRPA